MTFTAIVREFATAIVNPHDPEAYLHRLTIQATEALSAQACGMMVQKPTGDLGFAAASTDAAIPIEIHQERVQEGACFDAFHQNELMVVSDIEEYADRWPGYRARLLECGYRSVLGVPMNAFGDTIGVLNIYRTQAGPWQTDTIEVAEAIAVMAAGALTHANDLRAQHELSTRLGEIVEFRDRIGQAKGIIMAKHDVDADTAFEILREVSQTANRKLRDVATLIAEGELDP